MHTQNTLHLSDSQYQEAISIIQQCSDFEKNAVVDILVNNGIRQYPAEILVSQFHSYNQLSAA